MTIEELKDELAQSDNYSVEPQKYCEHHQVMGGVVFIDGDGYIKSDTVMEVQS